MTTEKSRSALGTRGQCGATLAWSCFVFPLRALPGREVVEALVRGGLRLRRRANGVAVLERGDQTFEVPADRTLKAVEVVRILRATGTTLDDFLDWLGSPDRGAPDAKTSGFHTRQTVEPAGSDPAAVRERAAQLRARMTETLAASRAIRERLERPLPPDSARVRAAFRRAAAFAAELGERAHGRDPDRD